MASAHQRGRLPQLPAALVPDGLLLREDQRLVGPQRRQLDALRVAVAGDRFRIKGGKANPTTVTPLIRKKLGLE